VHKVPVMGLLGRLRDHRKRDRIPTELFVPAPACPAYQSEPLVPDFLPGPPVSPARPRNQRATGYDARYGN
jgi:hypothetical protein